MNRPKVSFDQNVRVRRHIHRSSITKQEMELTWYTRKELYAAKIALKKQDEQRDEQSKQRRNRLDTLLSSAMRTIERASSNMSVGSSEDLSSLTDFEKRRRRNEESGKGSGRSKGRSQSWMPDVTNAQKSPKASRRSLLRKANSSPALIQDDKPPLNYELLHRQQRHLSHTRQPTRHAQNKKPDFSGVKESPVYLKRRSFKAMPEQSFVLEEEPPLDYAL